MVANGMNVWGEILGIAVGGGILLIFGILMAITVKHTNKPAGRRGRRLKPGEGASEPISSDGYIDTFAGIIEEAGGGLPPLVWAALIGIPLWWLIYMILNWSPYLINIITYTRPSFQP